jgi:CheY-like chemotaxis protein
MRAWTSPRKGVRLEAVTAKVLFITADAALAAAMKRGLNVFEVFVHDNLMGLYSQVTKVEPDVLVLDGDLPRLGLEAASKFLKAKGLSRNLPVILYTTPQAEEDPFLLQQRCQADDFVEKDPADFSRLRRVVRRLTPQAAAFDGVETGEHGRPFAMSGEGKPLILVVDDDEPIARMLGKILDTRFATVVVHGGAEAIEECRHRNFAAVFCDLKMPVTSGPDVYRAIRALDPLLADRVVFVTAHQLDSNEAEFFLSLKNTVIHKPFSMREILSTADAVLARAHVVAKAG